MHRSKRAIIRAYPTLLPNLNAVLGGERNTGLERKGSDSGSHRIRACRWRSNSLSRPPMVHLVHCDLTLLGSAGFAEREEVLPKHFFGAYVGEAYDPSVNVDPPRDAPYEYFGFCDTKPLYGNLEEGYRGYRPLAQRHQVCPVHSNPTGTHAASVPPGWTPAPLAQRPSGSTAPQVRPRRPLHYALAPAPQGSCWLHGRIEPECAALCGAFAHQSRPTAHGVHLGATPGPAGRVWNPPTSL